MREPITDEILRVFLRRVGEKRFADRREDRIRQKARRLGYVDWSSRTGWVVTLLGQKFMANPRLD